MAKTVRLAFVGCGNMASAHMKDIAPMPDVDIVAFCDIDPAKIQARQAEFAALRPKAPKPLEFTDSTKMIPEVKPDAVYILIPPYAHGATERTCLATGTPFFVEKPVGLDMVQTDEIAAEVARTGLITCAGYMNRHRAGIQEARRLMQADPPVFAYGGWIGGSPSTQPGATDLMSWWVSMKKSGGQIVEQSTHTFDIIRFVCGETVEVYAAAARGFNKGIFNYDLDDASTVTLKLAGGGIVNLFSSCSANGGGGGVTLTIYGHDTTLQFTGWEHSVTVMRKGVEPEVFKGEGDIFAVEDALFIDAVRSGDASAIRSPYPDAAKTLELTLAANESIRTGQPVRLSH